MNDKCDQCGTPTHHTDAGQCSDCATKYILSFFGNTIPSAHVSRFGICPRCKTKDRRENRTYCADCLRDYQQEQREDAGNALCVSCHKRKQRGANPYCRRCLDEHLNGPRPERHQRPCACCGIDKRHGASSYCKECAKAKTRESIIRRNTRYAEATGIPRRKSFWELP